MVVFRKEKDFVWNWRQSGNLLKTCYAPEMICRASSKKAAPLHDNLTAEDISWRQRSSSGNFILGIDSGSRCHFFCRCCESQGSRKFYHTGSGCWSVVTQKHFCSHELSKLCNCEISEVRIYKVWFCRNPWDIGEVFPEILEKREQKTTKTKNCPDWCGRRRL